MLAMRRITMAIQKMHRVDLSNVRLASSKAKPAKPAKTPKQQAIDELLKDRVIKPKYVPQPNEIQKKTGNTDPTEGNVNYVPNPMGRLFQSILHKGGGGRSIAANDFRRLMVECEKAEDVKYAEIMYCHLQKNSYDFSENLNARFVEMCVKFDRLDLVVKIFTTYQYRLGAWTTPNTFERLIIASDEKGVTASMLPVMHCLVKKGVLMKRNSIESLVKAAVPCDPAVYDKTLYYVGKVRGEEEMRLLAEKYPNVPVVVEGESEPAAESVDGEAEASEEGEEEGAKKVP